MQVVIDELHMICGEGDRGSVLEILCTKMLYAAVKRQRERGAAPSAERLQLIGMSATLPDLPALAGWLGEAQEKAETLAMTAEPEDAPGVGRRDVATTADDDG